MEIDESLFPRCNGKMDETMALGNISNIAEEYTAHSHKRLRRVKRRGKKGLKPCLTTNLGDYLSRFIFNVAIWQF